MLYSEFVQGTGCKETEHNYEVYKDLEVMYMNSDISKEKIYEYGKKLVDNSKTEKELQFEAEIKAEIESVKEEIKSNKEWISYYEAMAMLYKGDDEDAYKANKDTAKRLRKSNKLLRGRIQGLKWVLQ